VKCATIAEAEMLAEQGMPDILLAYQPVGPKIERLAELCIHFVKSRFACLIDNATTASEISRLFAKHKITLPVYVDLNVGMNRTGISPNDAFDLIEKCRSLPGIKVTGLHAYDGHLRDVDFETRKKRCDVGFTAVRELHRKVHEYLGSDLTIVAGGTPTYSIHCKRSKIECSPGTFIYWDKGYESILPEQQYLHAAVIATRVISKPSEDTICIDLGHKAIASENPLLQRIHFLSAGIIEPTGHSEEHMTLKIKNVNQFNIGDVLYGIPVHICPTVALHDRVHAVEGNTVTCFWNTRARNRYLTY
jgi:D-serine deaminase-like pyridoxal phosphate-dependent protein